MKKKKSAESDTIHTLQLDRGLSSLTWLMGRVSWSLLRNSSSPCYTRRKERKKKIDVFLFLRILGNSVSQLSERWSVELGTHTFRKDIKWHPFFSWSRTFLSWCEVWLLPIYFFFFFFCRYKTIGKYWISDYSLLLFLRETYTITARLQFFYFLSLSTQ